MPRLGAIKRRDVIRYLLQLGFEGPFAGGRHQLMFRATRRGEYPIRIAAM